MTPTQLEHLKRIDAHLKRLLDIASKRTPGEWETDQRAKRPAVFNTEGLFIDTNMRPCDAAFIASCAGNAEAGWRATRAAIAGYLKASTDDSWAVSLVASEVLESILAAFPLETLNPQKP